MIEKGKIGLHQLMVLTVLFTVGSSILIMPAGMAHAAKQDAWIAAIAALAGGLLLALFFHAVSALYPGKNLAEIAEQSLGKWFGGAVALFYFVYFFILSALVLRNIGDFITTQVLPNTPIQFVHTLFLIAVVMGIRNGIEVFTRTAEIFFPWVLFFFATMAVLLPPKFEPGYVSPLFGYGFKPILHAALPVIGTPYMELVAFLMILPYVSSPKKSRSAFLVGVAIGGSMLVVIALLSILVLGPDLTARQMYPSFSLAKKISIGSFLERLEVIMAGIWFITIYFKLAISFYASSMIFSRLFRMKAARPLYFPLGMVMIVLSIVAYPNISYFLEFANIVYLPYSFVFAVFFPLLMITVSSFKKRGGKPSR